MEQKKFLFDQIIENRDWPSRPDPTQPFHDAFCLFSPQTVQRIKMLLYFGFRLQNFRIKFWNKIFIGFENKAFLVKQDLCHFLLFILANSSRNIAYLRDLIISHERTSQGLSELLKVLFEKIILQCIKMTFLVKPTEFELIFLKTGARLGLVWRGQVVHVRMKFLHYKPQFFFQRFKRCQ